MRVSFLSEEIGKRILNDVPEQDLDKEVQSAKVEIIYKGVEGLQIECWEYTSKQGQVSL